MTIANKEFELLRTFLKDMFQFEDHDLDFGIYRIIRLKRRFIWNFIDGDGENSLRTTVTRALGGVRNTRSDTARNWLSAFAGNYGTKGSEKWQAVAESPHDEKALEGLKSLLGLADDAEREQAEQHLKTFLETRQLSAEQLEVKVYNHLLNFFELYYQNGDFGYNTRAASAFKVPCEVQRDLLEKVFHKVRYDIDKRCYRYETVRQSVAGEPGDFIDRYSVTYEFEKDEERRAFEQNGGPREQLELNFREPQEPYHIYEPLLNEVEEKLLKKYKFQRVGISPDKLNGGERKFLRDILSFIDTNYSRDHREFYLMRNVESLRSIGLYLEGETRVFYPDFVLWIVDDKAHKTTLVLFDPKGQTGIVKEDDLGLNGADGMNDKVRVATGGQLAELARQLRKRTGRQWDIHSYILLRDTSKLGKWKGAAATDKEMELAEAMIQKGVLRLDWHQKNEQGQDSVPLRDGRSYLSRIFERLI